MSYWIREIAGWSLVLIGLFAFWQAYDFLMMKRIFQAGPMTFVGFVVFRGGVHLLKVAVAAQAARNIPESYEQTGKKRPLRVNARPIGPTAVKSIIPGPNTTRTTGERRAVVSPISRDS